MRSRLCSDANATRRGRPVRVQAVVSDREDRDDAKPHVAHLRSAVRMRAARALGKILPRDCEQEYVDCTFNCSVDWGPGATWCFRTCYDARRACKVRGTLPSVQGNAARDAQSDATRPGKKRHGPYSVPPGGLLDSGVTGTWHPGTRADRHAAAASSSGRRDAALSATQFDRRGHGFAATRFRVSARGTALSRCARDNARAVPRACPTYRGIGPPLCMPAACRKNRRRF